MRPSTWLLIAVLVALLGHYPWLITAAFGIVAAVAAQPALLAVLAAGIVAYRVRRLA